MAFGIYKQGQGYWVRTMSAVFVGVLFFVAAGWGWDQAQEIRLPAKAHRASITVLRGAPTPEMILVLERASDDGTDERIGSAVVGSYIAATERTGTLEVRNLSLKSSDISAGAVRAVRSEGDEFAASVSGVQAVPLIPELYLQASVAGVIILLGTGIVFWFVGSNRKTVEFLIATDGEMKKVNWSTKKEVIGSTQVVIVAAFLIATILFGIDVVFSYFFKLVGVLES